MKNKLIMFLLILLSCCCMFSLSACLKDSDEEIAKTNITKLIDVIQKKDVEGIKLLFASNKISKLENFDKSIDDLIFYFQGENNSIQGDVGPITDNDKHNGITTKLHTIVIDITTTVKEYRFAIKWRVKDSSDVGNVGIWKLFVSEKTDDINQEFAYWGDENAYGIFIG